MGLNVGDIIPLRQQTGNYSNTDYVRAYVETPTGAAISGSPFNLTLDKSTGFYVSNSALMPNQIWVTARYLFFSDSGYTMLSTQNGGDCETFYKNISVTPSGGTAPTSNIIAFVDGDICNAGPIEDTIVQGSDRVLTIRLASEVGGAAFDLTDATAIEFRMRNTDGTILSVTLLNAVQIVNAGGGQITISLAAAQTALLAALLPSPCTIKVTISSKVTVINLPTQIAVQEVEA